MAYNRSARKYRTMKPQGSAPVFVTLKGEVPRAIEPLRNPGPARPGAPWSSQPEELKRVFRAWQGQPVELYGNVIQGYGDQAPYNQAHIPCRLAGNTAYSVVNLDEFNELVDVNSLPSRPIGR